MSSFLDDLRDVLARLTQSGSQAQEKNKLKYAVKGTYIPVSARTAMLEELNRSKVFTFEYQQKYGFVLTSCKKDYDGARKLTVPDVVSRIGREAFRDCLFLESIYIPDSVKVIEAKAFAGCTNLSEVRFSKNLTEIMGHAFDKSGITEAIFHDGLRKLGDRAFYDCAQLEKVSLPETLDSFEIGVFYGCEKLSEINLPMNMRGTFCNVFAHCKELETAHIPQGISEIQDWSYEYCDKLKDVYIPDSVTKICNRAFLHCRSLEYVYLPDSVEEIEVAAVFAGCVSLKKIRLPIGIRFKPRFEKEFDKVFFDCSALDTVVLGSHSFHVDEPPDEKDILAMRTELAAEGNPTARRCFLGELQASLCLVADRGDVKLAEKLLSCGILTTDTVDIEEYDKVLDYAAEVGASEIYVMLLQYKRDKLGYETPEDRFRL